MNPSILNDSYSRNINYLRVSVTDRCNLRCVYCRPDGEIPKLKHDDILRYEEIIRIIKICIKLGISKVRITGGEPLVRKGVFDFIKALHEIPGIYDISLTTNGVLLKDNLERIRSSGIKRINISLDTLDPEKFGKITGFDAFKDVWEGIKKAHELDFNPIKINVVALKGINDDEFLKFAKLTFSYPFQVRFIEHMPLAKSAINYDDPLLSDKIKDMLSVLGNLTPINRGGYDGPAKKFRFKGAKGEIGFISPVSDHFCKTCNRLRLTASGHIRPCLLSDYQEDLKTPLRAGCSDDDLVKIIRKTIEKKPSGHKLSFSNPVSIRMSSIGG